MKSKSGFTIVELLVVIVVIAILSAITVTAYQGVQQRSNNASIRSSAQQAIKVVYAYIAANGYYPDPTSPTTDSNTYSYGCLSKDCHNGSATLSWYLNTPAVTRLKTIGSLPGDVPAASTIQNGIWYYWKANFTYNGESKPLRITYHLFGNNQQCGMSNIATNETSASTTTTGYTVSYGDNRTACTVSIDGPPAI